MILSEAKIKTTRANSDLLFAPEWFILDQNLVGSSRGKIKGTEACDDGNTFNGDGCKITCQDTYDTNIMK